jgi:hypothetical protein
MEHDHSPGHEGEGQPPRLEAVGNEAEEERQSFWTAHPTAKKYATSVAIAGPFGVAVTFVGDTAPYVGKEVRRAINGLRGLGG